MRCVNKQFIEMSKNENGKFIYYAAGKPTMPTIGISTPIGWSITAM